MHGKNRMKKLRKMIRTGYRKSLEALLGPPKSEKKKRKKKRHVSSATTAVNTSKRRKTDVTAATASTASALRETIINMQENDKENTGCDQENNSEQKDKKERHRNCKNDMIKVGNEEAERSPLLLSLSSTLSPSLPSKQIFQTTPPTVPASAPSLPTATATAAPIRTEIMELEIDNEIEVLGVDDADEDEPHVLNEETQREHSYCDDARNRGVWEERGDERLPFGFFAGGCEDDENGTICRNKLNNEERLEDGFVTLSNLILPECQSVIVTTFDSGCMVEETIRFLRDSFGGKTGTLPSQMLVLGHGDCRGSAFCAIPSVIPDDPSPTTESPSPSISLPITDGNNEWFWIACRPFGKEQNLMHAKVLLFRSTKGVRIVVSGNNLTEHQWTEDRDCMWILDIPVNNVVDLTGNFCQNHLDTTPLSVTPEGDSYERYSDNDERYSDIEPPIFRLRHFLVDLMKSSPAFHDIDNRLDRELTSFVFQRVGALLDGLCQNHPINCTNGINNRGQRCMFRFVYSFPRLFRRGGWQQLAGAVRALQQQEDAAQQLSKGVELMTKAPAAEDEILEDDDMFYDTDNGYSDDEQDGNNMSITRAMELEESIHLYAMSGSLGDLKPDFLRQMRLAFCGFDLHTGYNDEGYNIGNDRLKKWLVTSTNIDWSNIQNTYCLWPSQQMVKNMNPIALFRGRPMSWKHWKSIPKPAQRRLFFDAVPNPYKPALICTTESQIAAGCGGISTNKIIRFDQGEYRLRAGVQDSYYAFTHGKALVASNMMVRNRTTAKTIYSNSINKIFEKKISDSNSSKQQYTAIYAGSHNFSKKAWGIRRTQPGNVEFGVILFTTQVERAEKWRRRLPYRLPKPGEDSTGYRPGRRFDIFKITKNPTTKSDNSNGSYSR